MDKKFIDQVHDIVMRNITDEKFGVPKLASILGLSPSQTLKKVRAETGKSVNQYIRELRLKQATKLIKKTDLTNAEISYKVGFSSQSYFNKTFRKRYGITPGEYKTQNISLAELASKRSKNKTRNNHIIKRAFYVVPIVVLFAVGYFLINTTSAKIVSKPNSIAVLPFKDMSPEDNQWFSDGISDNILTYLSQIKGLSVISFTSSSTYRNTDKKIPEIAKELGVSYILEGSITVYEDKIKINTQLINANDEHMWSEDYIISFEDVITIQQNVSKEIAKELELTLSPIEVAALEKYPTENMEAYQLVLKGRSIVGSIKKEDLEKSIEFYKQAIVLDSNYAEAYAEIAQSYNVLNKLGFMNFDLSLNNARSYIDKALKIDPISPKATAVMATLEWRINKKSENIKGLFEKAIRLNPNDATANYQYGLYFNIKPNKDVNKSLKHLRIAQQLDPYSYRVNQILYYTLIMNDRFEEAEELLNKWGFVYSETSRLLKESKLKALKNKDWTESIRFFKAKIETEPNNAILYNRLANAYDAILNDDENAIKYAKKAYKIDSTNYDNSHVYFDALVEGEKFKEVKTLLESENFKKVLSEKQQLMMLFYYYYHQENYKKAQEVLSNSLLKDYHLEKVLNYAQLGEREKVDSLLDDSRVLGDFEKATVYATLKERDSMYYYLGKLDNFYWTRTRSANSRKEFDPYRKEERYKVFLRKNYLPITHWNE